VLIGDWQALGVEIHLMQVRMRRPHSGTARRRNAVEHERPSGERPQPPFVAVRPVARLIGVDDGLVRQHCCEFGIRRRQSRARFLPCMLGAPQTDRNLQRAFEEALHDQPRHAAHDGQIRNQGRRFGAELVRVLVGQPGQCDGAAVGTLAAMAAELGDVRRNRRHLRDVMPTRMSDRIFWPMYPKLYPLLESFGVIRYKTGSQPIAFSSLDLRSQLTPCDSI
jgi:hypothetical protein